MQHFKKPSAAGQTKKRLVLWCICLFVCMGGAFIGQVVLETQFGAWWAGVITTMFSFIYWHIWGGDMGAEDGDCTVVMCSQCRKSLKIPPGEYPPTGGLVRMR